MATDPTPPGVPDTNTGPESGVTPDLIIKMRILSLFWLLNIKDTEQKLHCHLLAFVETFLILDLTRASTHNIAVYPAVPI